LLAKTRQDSEKSEVAATEIRGILFDLDQTLVDRAAVMRERLIPLLYEQQPAIRAEHSLDEATRLIMEADADGYGPPYYGYIVEKWPGVSMTAEQFTDWHYATLPGLYGPDPKVQGLLRSLERASIPWGIVTNGGKAQRGKMEHSGIRLPDERIIVSKEVGVEKPEPEIFHIALERIGTDASESLFVGDHPVNDIDGARRVGMRTAWVKRGREWPEELQPPDHVIDHVAELAGLIEAG
jgi:putative hydrolase of the HAD superfamily